LLKQARHQTYNKIECSFLQNWQVSTMIKLSDQQASRATGFNFAPGRMTKRINNETPTCWPTGRSIFVLLQTTSVSRL